MMKDIQPLNIGGNVIESPLLIAGPCSAETEEQTLETARKLSLYGLKIFRAGIWKPRTKPGGFEGVGEEGLKWLQRVKDETGMIIATEVANSLHVKTALAAGIDILWIGARTSANPFAVQEIADELEKIGKNIPVMVKNPVNPDLELWIGALERLYNAGIRQLAAIHRGFSVYGNHVYRNMPQWQIPIELKRRMANLPVIHDPSHMGGKRELVKPLAQQAIDMGFDGLIIESHYNPAYALSDKSQQITPEEFDQILKELKWRPRKDATERLDILRRQIDEIDDELIKLLDRRMKVSRDIGKYKKEHLMPVFQVDRHDSIMQNRVKMGKELGMSEDFMKKILRAIHEESVRLQLNILDDSPQA